MGITRSILETAVINQFDDTRYSHEDYLQFSEETVGAVIRNQALSGLTNAQRDNLQDAFFAYRDILSTEGTARSNQKGSTVDINEAWSTVVSEARRKEALVRSIFDRKTADYQRFYPKGLEEYNQARRGDHVRLIDNLITQFTTYSSQFPGVAGSLTALKAAYLTAASGQSQEKGGLRGTKTLRDLYRLTLAGALQETWLTIALKNMGHPEVIPVFFNTSIFDKGTNYDNDGLGRGKLLVLDMAGNPLINSRVVVRDQNGQDVDNGITDDNGYFETKDLPIGFYDFIANHPGYVDKIMQYQLFDNRDPLHEMRLSTL